MLTAETMLRWSQLPGVTIKALLVLGAQSQISVDDGWTSPMTKRAVMVAVGVSPSASRKIFEAVEAEFNVRECKGGMCSYQLKGDRKSITEDEARSEIDHDGDRKSITADEERSEIDRVKVGPVEDHDRKSIAEPSEGDRKSIAPPEARSEIDHAETAPEESLNTKDKDSDHPNESALSKSKKNPSSRKKSTASTTTTKPAYWRDLIGAIIDGYTVPGGKAARMAEQFVGLAVKGERAEFNFDPPARPEDIPPFLAWYRQQCPGAALPESAEAAETWWHKYQHREQFIRRSDGKTDVEKIYPNGMTRAQAKAAAAETVAAYQGEDQAARTAFDAIMSGSLS